MTGEVVQYPLAGLSFIVFSGIAIPATSGGISLGNILTQSDGVLSGQNILSYAVDIKFNGSGKIFIGTSGTFPVGSGATDLQRVGYPIDPTFSGTYNQGYRVVVSNPLNLYASAEVSGQIIFLGIETATYI